MSLPLFHTFLLICPPFLFIYNDSHALNAQYGSLNTFFHPWTSGSRKPRLKSLLFSQRNQTYPYIFFE